MKDYKCPDCGETFHMINDVNGYCGNCREHYNLDEAEKRVPNAAALRVEQVVRFKGNGSLSGKRGVIVYKNYDGKFHVSFFGHAYSFPSICKPEDLELDI